MNTSPIRSSVVGGLFAALAIAAAPFASAQTAAPGGATRTSVYGIALAQPFTAMPECPYKQGNYAGASKLYTSMYEISNPCFEHLKMDLIGTAPTGTERLYIAYPTGKYPEMYNGMTVSLVDGLVQDIHLVTNGVDSQERDYALLLRKFGKPLTNRTVPLQNRIGATFEGIEASWQLPGGVAVTFRGVNDQLDTGLLTVTTAEELARQQAKYDQQHAGAPKL
ncbi:hypothetical protein [Paraburkholderia dinghuensis]|uniref:Uncharacterized protein n=1 Tax=Paraburkholderia dinghuensis TaxID=2305225 RepID=A0A3N6M801_9BURK|nr:hypothetical protein [Paraburkholderia dinghuensis]RQG99813.1 hypothetical protein D1Y85_26160 [Paraburkholderia dinghuensis]